MKEGINKTVIINNLFTVLINNILVFYILDASLILFRVIKEDNDIL